MARKPKEFWAASYMFSFLMQCLLEASEKEKSLTLISPCLNLSNDWLKEKTEGPKKMWNVGLFPDRAFFKVDGDVDTKVLIDVALNAFCEKTKIEKSVARSFFHIMTVIHEYGSDSAAISGLNRKLDIMELSQRAWTSEDFDYIFTYLNDANRTSPLYRIGSNKDYFSIDTLEKIARDEKDELKYSYQKYVCIVQADGDNMGKIVSSEKLDRNLNSFSSSLMDFGKTACRKIHEFKGLPIYAGGDDLLFIAPVVSGNRTIFDLIGDIDILYKNVQDIVDTYSPEGKGEDGNTNTVHTSMSYGISITYYKYPLYEAWENARNLLFCDAKKLDSKNAISVMLRKNSGSDFRVTLSKEDVSPYGKLGDLIGLTENESLVSAVSHKVRANLPLLSTILKEWPSASSDARIKNFYKNIVDVEAKSDNEKSYLEITEEILKLISRAYFTDKEAKSKKESEKGCKSDKTTVDDDMNTIISRFYSLLRIAKFIKGEELKDE